MRSISGITVLKISGTKVPLLFVLAAQKTPQQQTPRQQELAVMRRQQHNQNLVAERDRAAERA